MYYICRFFIISIFVLLFIFILVKSKKFVLFPKFTNPKIYKKYCTDVKYKKSCLLLNLTFSIIIMIIIFASFYPYEGHFITFETVVDSLEYKNINTQDITMYEYEDCVFVVDNNNYSIHSITKIGDRYKLVDFNSKNIEYTQPKIIGSESITNPQSAKFNNDINKTFYLIGIKTNENPHDDVLLDGNKMTFCKEATTNHFAEFKQKKYWIYSYIDNLQPKSNFVIEANDFTATIYKTPYISRTEDE